MNHSLEFRNEETGAHTNSIEGLWRHAKRAVPPSNRQEQLFLGYLATFMLRKTFADERDGFSKFFRVAAAMVNTGRLR